MLTDLWSLGVLYFRMLFNRFPFEGSDKTELSDKILNCQYVFPERVTPKQRSIISNLLQIDPCKRTGISQLIKDLM